MAAPGYVGRIKGLRRLFIAPLSVDTAATTTYGTAISLGAQSKLTFQPVGESADLKTSNAIVNSHTVWTHGTWSIEFGEMSLEVLDAVYGGKKYADAVGSKNTFAFLSGQSAGYFGIFGQPDVVEGGPLDAYLGLLKCKVETGSPIEMGGSVWAMQNLGGRCFYTLKDTALFGVAMLEAVTSITAAAVVTDVQTAIASGS